MGLTAEGPALSCLWRCRQCSRQREHLFPRVLTFRITVFREVKYMNTNQQRREPSALGTGRIETSHLPVVSHVSFLSQLAHQSRISAPSELKTLASNQCMNLLPSNISQALTMRRSKGLYYILPNLNLSFQNPMSYTCCPKRDFQSS